MKQPGDPARQQQEIEVAAAWLIATGMVFALGGLWPVLGLLVSTFELSLIYLALPLGISLTVCGFAMKRGRRHAWTASMATCALGLAWLPPSGPFLFGMMLRMLWKIRRTYPLALTPSS